MQAISLYDVGYNHDGNIVVPVDVKLAAAPVDNMTIIIRIVQLRHFLNN